MKSDSDVSWKISTDDDLVMLSSDIENVTSNNTTNKADNNSDRRCYSN